MSSRGVSSRSLTLSHCGSEYAAAPQEEIRYSSADDASTTNSGYARPHAAALSASAAESARDENELRGRTPSFAEGDGSDGHHGAGGIAGGLGADGGALVGGERGAEVEGAGGRLRLSHAYL